MNKMMYQKRKIIDKIMKLCFLGSALIAASLIILIVIFIVLKGIKVFLPNYEYGTINILDFIFHSQWNVSKSQYGIGFIVLNTVISGFLALCISVPFALCSALFIVRMAPKKIALLLHMIIDLLASIPSVVYGVFAAGTITQFCSKLSFLFTGVHSSGNSLLAVILLLAIMIYPTITSLSMSAIEAVDRSMIEGSYALGVSKIQTDYKLVLKCAKSGIFAGIILGLGRAFGEASAVMMVAGNRMFGPSMALLEPTRTLTTTIVSGLKETTGLDYDIRFSVGLILMIVVIGSNFLLNFMKRKVGSKYA